ncbi:MAG: metallophosphoesterase family protein [Polyangiaceae bacterium]|nr:metallophosphoesterase family protein [Polyangiaceae bacterium]
MSPPSTPSPRRPERHLWLGRLSLALLATCGAAGIALAASAAGCKSDDTTAGTGGAGGGSTTFGTYTPEGCGYAVTLPTGIEAALGDDVGTGAPAHVHVSYAGPTDSSFAVNWQTDQATTATTILYGTDEAAVTAATAATGSVLAQRGHTAVYTGLLGGPTRVHEAHVCGLAADTSYYYKVGGTGAWSPVYSVATGPIIGSTASYRIAVLGDSRDDPGVFASLEELLYAQGAELVMFTGDAVQMGVDQNLWSAFFEAPGANGSIASILAGVPLMVSNGNHEALAVNYLMQFAMPQASGNGSAGKEWYSFDYANAHFVVLNDTTATPGLLDEQAAFLAADLAAVDRQTTPWVFAMHHRGLYSCSNHGSDLDLRDKWQPIYDQYAVDAVFNGHDHNYERSLPIRGFDPGTTDGTVAATGANGAPVASSGTVYVVAGGAGAPLYGSGTCYHTQVSESVRNYVLLEIAGTTLSWRAYRLDGTLLDSFDYTK